MSFAHQSATMGSTGAIPASLRLGWGRRRDEKHQVHPSLGGGLLIVPGTCAHLSSSLPLPSSFFSPLHCLSKCHPLQSPFQILFVPCCFAQCPSHLCFLSPPNPAAPSAFPTSSFFSSSIFHAEMPAVRTAGLAYP